MGGVPGNMGSQVGNIDADIREQEVIQSFLVSRTMTFNKGLLSNALLFSK